MLGPRLWLLWAWILHETQKRDKVLWCMAALTQSPPLSLCPITVCSLKHTLVLPLPCLKSFHDSFITFKVKLRSAVEDPSDLSHCLLPHCNHSKHLVDHDHLSLFQVSVQSRPCSGLLSWISEFFAQGLLGLRGERERSIRLSLVKEVARSQTQEVNPTVEKTTHQWERASSFSLCHISLHMDSWQQWVPSSRWVLLHCWPG